MKILVIFDDRAFYLIYLLLINGNCPLSILFTLTTYNFDPVLKLLELTRVILQRKTSKKLRLKPRSRIKMGTQFELCFFSHSPW